jgi:2-polyprenyl-6-hydroxyphenyl methylase/3-demethylubiquinone-9 3-methyltransferase
MQLPRLRLPSTAPHTCKICGGEAALFGTVDFHKSCLDMQGQQIPPAGIPIHYRRCKACEFLFTDAFDDWSVEEFRTHIYNDDYKVVDPEYAASRPLGNADTIEKFWGELRDKIRVLDFGGGNDTMCGALRAKGFTTALTYDPMVPEYARRPEGKFDLVTCFETLEHVPDPAASIAAMVDCAADPGLIFYSTLCQPIDFDTCRLGWWYVAPRNGHVSIFSRQAITLAWGRHGYKVISLNPCAHFAIRTLPPYLAGLQGQLDALARQGGPLAA